jgi:hypothetical protein
MTAPIVAPAIPPALNPARAAAVTYPTLNGDGDEVGIDVDSDEGKGYPGKMEKETEFTSRVDVDVVLLGGSDNGTVNISSAAGEDADERSSEIGTVNLTSEEVEVRATASKRGIVKRKFEVGVGEAGVSRYGEVGDGG